MSKDSKLRDRTDIPHLVCCSSQQGDSGFQQQPYLSSRASMIPNRSLSPLPGCREGPVMLCQAHTFVLNASKYLREKKEKKKWFNRPVSETTGATGRNNSAKHSLFESHCLHAPGWLSQQSLLSYQPFLGEALCSRGSLEGSQSSGST